MNSEAAARLIMRRLTSADTVHNQTARATRSRSLGTGTKKRRLFRPQIMMRVDSSAGSWKLVMLG